jgi:anti-sigma regulatory factor (Ser/Thr protein kinase)
LALVEWLTNVVAYSYEDEAEHRIRVRLTREDDCVRVEVQDDGRRFNPLEHPPTDISIPLAEKPIGGLGIHMIRHLMDSVHYKRRGGKNVLTMTKRAR